MNTKKIEKRARQLSNLPITVKILLAIFLEVVGFFIQPLPIIGPIYTLFVLLLVAFFMFGLIGFLQGWELIYLDLAGYVPTMILLALAYYWFSGRLTTKIKSKSKKGKRRRKK